MASGIAHTSDHDKIPSHQQSFSASYSGPEFPLSAPTYHTVSETQSDSAHILTQQHVENKGSRRHGRGSVIIREGTGEASRDEAATLKADIPIIPPSDDIYKLTAPVQITFIEVFREPRGTEIPETLYNLHRTLFMWTQRGVYTFYSAIFGTILAIVWGLVFGVVSFVITWCAQPALKVLFMFARVVTTAVTSIIRACVEPLFHSCSLVLSGIKGSFQLNITGLGYLGTMVKKRQGLSRSESRSMMY